MLGGLDRRFRPAAKALLTVAQQAGIRLQVTSTRRSRAKQALLYRRYMAGLSKLPALPPGHSLHERGLALDVWSADASALRALGAWWLAEGGTWGGKADPVHFGAPRSWW